jgi:hypothetical protein
MMKRPCLTSPVLRKGTLMNRAWPWLARQEMADKEEKEDNYHYLLYHNNGVSISCDICGSVDASHVQVTHQLIKIAISDNFHSM